MALILTSDNFDNFMAMREAVKHERYYLTSSQIKERGLLHRYEGLNDEAVSRLGEMVQPR